VIDLSQIGGLSYKKVFTQTGCRHDLAPISVGVYTGGPYAQVY
jgi:hypothetical protein